MNGRRLATPVGLAALALLALAVGGCTAGTRAAEPTTSTVARAAGAGGGAEAAGAFRSPRAYQAPAEPVGVRIPRIGVRSGLERLGRAADGTIQVPTRWEVAGWYAPGPRPGQPGSAVILGHVDSKRGPAVFARLRELRRGDRIDIDLADGRVASFAVDRVGRYAKASFPTDEVYFPTLVPTLRLVTCGGSFDAEAGHYRANVIAFATLTSSSP